MERSPLIEAFGAVMPWLWLVMLGALVLVVLSTLFEVDPLGFLRSSSSTIAAKLSKGDAVVGYKVANLRGSGFTGVSGGGAYSFVSEGRLNPGFHCFRDLATLQSSSYSHSGRVILEVLIYGDVAEYEDGYIGSNQRVLQVIPNAEGSGCCYSCNRGGIELYVDRNGIPDRSFYWGPDVAFICKPCMKLTKFLSTFALKGTRGRFVPIQSYFEAANRKSGNPSPIGYARSLRELTPTVLPAESSAR